jgi:hypothetical protein
MPTYRAIEVTGKREFSLVTRELGEPLPGQRLPLTERSPKISGTAPWTGASAR